MARPMKTEFVPQNPQKYTGKYPIIARSRWERDFMNTCDMRDNVLEWASEPVQVPYRDPLTGQQKVYVPDFLVTRIDKNSHERVTTLIEIKPIHEQLTEFARSAQDAAIQARNRAKWGAAIQWCAHRGIAFEIMNERQLFHGGNLIKPRVKPVAEYAPGLTKKPKRPKLSAVKKKLSAVRKRVASIKKSRVGKARRIKKV